MATSDTIGTDEAAQPRAIAHPTFGEAAATYAKIGFLSFGGPAGQIALMHRLLVDEKRWISEERFLHALNYCMLLPGPEAQQLATYTGWLLHGTRGGIVAGTLFVLPGFFVILALSTIYALFHSTAIVGAVFFGMKAAVLAVVIEALLRVSKRALKNRFMVALAGAAFLAIFALQVPFPVIVLLAGLIGFVGVARYPDLFASAPHKAGKIAPGPFLELADPPIDRNMTRALKIFAAWGALWAAPVPILGGIFGWDSVFMPIAGFFSEMAVVTFGGAYAVLAYVAQEAVTGLGWLRPGEMLDGLALAETTPGPLILVLVFVGFQAGFRFAPGIDPLLSGIIAAALTTWVTFMPCFLWIFLGAPYIERLRNDKSLSGALSAITAAVVGVILNLAVWFGLHVVFRDIGTVSLGPISIAWPQFGSIDLLAFLLAVGAALAMFRFKITMIPTLAGSAILGLVCKLLL